MVVALWRPLLYPAGKAALLLLDVYSPSLVGTDLAALITPEPLERETSETIDGVAMRVSWWRPAWGDRHPAILMVNGATPVGNDNVVTRDFGRTLARAGYLVMLAEFPFLKEGRLDADAPRVVDRAFAMLRALPETAGEPVGAFGASVGAGLVLAAAGRYPAIGAADHLTVLGGYFDMRTYVAAVATRTQPTDAGLVRWDASAEVEERVPPALEAAMRSDADRDAVRRAFSAAAYPDAIRALGALSGDGLAIVEALSPSTRWRDVAPPVFWIHDPNDDYEPVSEAYAARGAPRGGPFQLIVPRLLQHAEVGASTKGQSPFALAGELGALLRFVLDVLRVAG